jgi:hypothetical protein
MILLHHRTSSFRTTLTLGLVVAVSVLPGIARACPFCSAVSLTFSQEIEQSAAAVVAQLVTPPPASALSPVADGPLPKGIFQVAQVLKGAEFVEQQAVGEMTQIEAILLEDKPVGSLFLLLGIEPPQLIWSSPIAINQRVVDYLLKLPALPVSGPDRLAFFQEHLEDPDAILARDAYDEFAVAPYDDVRGLKDRMDAAKLLGWIRDPNVQANRRRLYATMLGVCGTEEDAAAIATILGDHSGDEINPDVRTGLDALIACYVTLRGGEGLGLVDRLFLERSERDVPFTETYAAVMALRFLGEESEIVPRERVLASLRLLLAEPKLADLVIADLARWQDWSVIDTLATLFAEAGTDNIFVREPVVNYLRVCPLPEAAEALARCEAIDPEAVRRAATLAGFAGGFAPPNSAAAAADPANSAAAAADSANSAAAAADPASSGGDEELARQVPPVLADTDATDDTPAIDPSLAVADAAAASDGAATAETRSSATNAVGETPEPPIAWGRWLIWAAIVVAVGLLARVAMRPRAGVTQS